MVSRTYRAMIVDVDDDGRVTREIGEKGTDELPAGEVLVRVKWSSLNYKDGLSASGNRGVTRNYPHTPGIDAAGVVEVSESSLFRPGDEVVVTSYDLGMNTPGGFGQYIRVPAEWVVPMPAGLDCASSMQFGTAGFTAAMSVHALAAAVKPGGGEVLVTGATGGVGCLAAAMLARLGYRVTGVSGKESAGEFLHHLGVTRVIDREAAMDSSSRPLLKAQWSGVVDTVGGDILATAVKSTNPGGVITCCGNVASPDLPLNVFPFILRGVSLVGIDSQNCPMDHRKLLWHKLVDEYRPSMLADICRAVSLDELEPEIGKILSGGQTGRVIVSLDDR